MQQAVIIAVGALLLLALCISFAVISHDWNSLRQSLLFVGAFVAVVGLFSGSAWLLVRILAKKHHADDSKIEKHHDA